MEMFRTRMLKAKTHSEVIRTKPVVANPMDTSAKARTTNANDIGILLSYRATNQPETGSPINELRGINKRMVPNSASLNPKKVFMVGILEAQDEKQTPETKKKVLKKMRCLFFKSMLPIRLQK